jgi:hypothetical protein
MSGIQANLQILDEANQVYVYPPIATRPIFQTKAKPRMRAVNMVQQNCTMLIKVVKRDVMTQRTETLTFLK